MKQKIKRKVNHQSLPAGRQGGAAMLISVIFFLFISLAIISGLVAPSIREFRNANVNLNSKKSYFLAESGGEDATYRLIKNMAIGTSETIVLDSNSVTTTITSVGNSTKQIDALGDVTSYQRKVKTVLSTDVGVSFNYGVQIGDGGLEMKNTSRVIGNVYSNGNITGENSPRITGTAVVAGATGKLNYVPVDQDVTAHFIEDSTVGGSTSSVSLLRTTVGGNAVSDSIANCTIGGNATYDTKTSCSIGGTQTTPNPSNFVDPVAIPLPITDIQVQGWQAEAAAGGVISSQTYSSGVTSLGPKKINGDLTVKNTATLNVTGTLWVTGKVSFENSAIVQLDPSYGGSSGVIVAGIGGSTTAGLIELKNSAQVNGSGTAGSYMMLLSQMVNTASSAIEAGNSGTAAILYAGHGLIDINNNGAFKEITGAKIKVSNSATITYESGLANSNFSGGPSGSWTVQSWKESQ